MVTVWGVHCPTEVELLEELLMRGKLGFGLQADNKIVDINNKLTADLFIINDANTRASLMTI
jgi:hypothetical protein